MKDFIPIFWSSVAKRLTNTSRSKASPSEVHLEPAIDRHLRRAQRDGRPARELRGHLRRSRVRLVRRDDFVGEPDRQRFDAADHASREHDVFRARRADQPWQALRPPGARDDAEQYLRLAHLRVVGDDAEVARHRELTSTAERISVDRCDGDLGDLLDHAEHALHHADAVHHLGRRAIGHHLDVRAGGEDLLAAPQDDGLDLVVERCFASSLRKPLGHFLVDRVHLRAVQADRADAGALIDLEPNELGHNLPLVLRFFAS